MRQAVVLASGPPYLARRDVTPQKFPGRHAAPRINVDAMAVGNDKQGLQFAGDAADPLVPRIDQAQAFDDRCSPEPGSRALDRPMGRSMRCSSSPLAM